ncbi:MAG: hypothetical protein ACD_15C00135G0006 [uncultured bacterium]|nr:MAG: hypothetical protein ACD_15C00135G0006 [uncultured bacterium]OGN56970.1 MAG: hypothetical protein A2796_06595 [Chlamydiae bacterium RIFCSPHIGHO2_01_FULL_44_39]OGN59663.1 MAG: hypothetical protein A3D96_06470 [Chlamydiae bacterium RIFCSPHIGHO2_12_FULL_44_59]OGN65753.1 MAG: hypothetical protein A2978_07465 [Chlamydiae bacterium RIFCSPLOWO2_01_FULL_44_52]OGN67896.1 MAG: hypothetical protein A3I67_05945 [Chlamydiae bacterium RIFCSPLOWO2_02_FULL_45_22]OGN69386.1 MAG: hypothetical protein A3
MIYLEQFAFKSPKLLIFYLGGNTEKSHIEMHDVVFVIAKTDVEAAGKIRQAWYGTEKSLHVDSWFVAEEVDGFNIKISKNRKSSQTHLYFVNLGYYKNGIFGENHFMTLVVAGSKIEAIEKANKKCYQDLEMLHSDNVYDLDDCIRIDEVDHSFIELEYRGLPKKPIMPINGYHKLRPHPSNFELSDKNL